MCYLHQNLLPAGTLNVESDGLVWHIASPFPQVLCFNGPHTFRM